MLRSGLGALMTRLFGGIVNYDKLFKEPHQMVFYLVDLKLYIIRSKYIYLVKIIFHLFIHFLGDSAYPQEPWMYTAIIQPRSNQELRHNAKIKGTRVQVENAIGLLKARFRCLDKSGGILMYTPKKVCKFVIVCIMLHNIRRGLRLPEDENMEDVNVEEDDINPEEEPVDMNLPLRQQLVDLLGA